MVPLPRHIELHVVPLLAPATLQNWWDDVLLCSFRLGRTFDDTVLWSVNIHEHPTNAHLHAAEALKARFLHMWLLETSDVKGLVTERCACSTLSKNEEGGFLANKCSRSRWVSLMSVFCSGEVGGFHDLHVALHFLHVLVRKTESMCRCICMCIYIYIEYMYAYICKGGQGQK